MIGFSIACIYCICMMLFSGYSFAAVFLASTNFLFQWYICTSALIIGLLVLIAMGVGGVSAFFLRGCDTGLGQLISSIIGFGGASSLTLMFSFRIIFRRILFIISSYLLSISISLAAGGVVWSLPHLIIGAVLIIFALKR